MDDLKQQLSDQQITIAILTVPSTAAQKTTDEMVDAGVKGIMNFTPIRLSAPADVRVQNVDLATELQDRKSTRLNSSHVSISYAVFCLKKKNKINTRQQTTLK